MERSISKQAGWVRGGVRGLMVAVTVGALGASGCDGKASAEQGGATASSAAAPSADSAAARIVGTWVSEDGDHTIVLTASTMKSSYESIPDAPSPVTTYIVDRVEGDTVRFTPQLDKPGGKPVKMSQQVFTLSGPDEMSGGLAGKKPTKFKRVK